MDGDARQFISGAPSVMLASSDEIEREEKKKLEESGVSPSDTEPDIPVIKPLQGMSSHGALSSVPMPIPPKPLGTPAV